MLFMSLSIPKLEMKYSETLSLQNRLLNKTLKLHLTGVCSDVHKLSLFTEYKRYPALDIKALLKNKRCNDVQRVYNSMKH